MNIEYYKDQNGILYRGDADVVIDYLAKFGTGKVDLVFTSPPYNNGTDYEGYDDNLHYSDYTKKMKSIFTKIWNIMSDGGRLCVNVSMISKNRNNKETHFLFSDINDIIKQSGFIEHDVIVWAKGSVTAYPSTAWGSWCSPSSPNMRSLAELILIYSKDNKKYIKDIQPDITAEEFKEYTKNIWFINQDREKYDHPCPFSINVATRIIKLYSYPGDTVLDPFCGTGNTLMAAAMNKRKYIGIEISKKYYDIAKSRLKEKVQTSLF